MSGGDPSPELPPPQDGRLDAAPDKLFDDRNARWWDGGQKVKVGESFTPRKLDTPLDKIMRKHGGRRSRTRVNDKRGHYIQSRNTPGNPYDLAFDATLRAA
ncbi:MAG TPA: magnesium chelatase, partial [Polyangia bacterium]